MVDSYGINVGTYTRINVGTYTSPMDAMGYGFGFDTNIVHQGRINILEPNNGNVFAK